MNKITAAGRGRARRRLLGRLAVASGLCLLGAAAWITWKSATAPPAYSYVLGDQVAAADLGALAPLAGKKITVRHATVVAPGHAQPLAELEVAESASGPVLVKWQAKIDDPFLTLLPAAQDVAQLAPVLQRHASGNLLAWWDTSRQLHMLSGVPVLFGEHLGLPLFVPARWNASRTRIESIERSFWASGDTTAQTALFRRFTDALLSDEEHGMAELKKLAGGKPAVLVLHVRDAILLGQMAPKKIGVAFQDFGSVTDVHGIVRRVHAWLGEHKYSTYAVLPDKDQSVRAIALTDEASGKTLAARLLPFMGNDQHDVKGATLVYRVGGFVVYQIEPDAAVAEAPAASPDEHR